MSDAVPSEYGVNAHGPRSRAGMTREQRQAHERLASLPVTRHSKTLADEMERQRKAADLSESLRRGRMNSTTTYVQQGRRVKGSLPLPRGKSQRLQILDALRKGPMTPDEIRAQFGAMRVSSRIADIRDMGHVVDCVRDADGTYRYVLRG